MKIGINAQTALLSDRAGAENYAYNLIRALAKVDSEDEYVLYLRTAPSKSEVDRLTQGEKCFTIKVLRSPFLWTQVRLGIQLLLDRPDVFFSPTHTLPVMCMRKIKMLVMIHGLEYRIDASWLVKKILDFEAQIVTSVAKVVIAPSSATKHKLLDSGWDLEPKKIKVIPEGVDSSFFKHQKAEIALKYGVGAKDKYLLFISTINLRKNLPSLISGFARVLVELGRPGNLKLLIAGKPGKGLAKAVEACKAYEVKDDVVFAGRIPDEDLPSLLSGAVAYINPSTEEGFGLPILEAAACETPCLASDIPAFRELAKDRIIYFNPNDAKSIKDAILQVLDPSFDRGLFTKNALSLAREHTWEGTAQETLQTFRDVFKNR